MVFGQTQHVCGLYYNIPYNGGMQQAYLPQVEVKVHASILATTSRTILRQTFANPSTTRGIRKVRYTFPLYDGVSVVGFSCQIGNRTIVGEVKEKESAKAVFKSAVARGETAGLLEQLPAASDVFTTTIGNIPPNARVIINITYLGELKHDMEVDGIRFTIPTSICPRYGDSGRSQPFPHLQMDGVISITVDAETAEGSFIQKLQSPTHPISMSMGTTSVEPDAVPSMSKASATLSLGTAHLDTDFVLQIIAKDAGIPRAILETHPSISNHRALMATLVPKFALPEEKPEIVFICDQSGSMDGSRMDLAIEALQVFLKSLPLGVKFNICSFGTQHSFMLPKSASYNQESLDYAVHHAERLQANYGGTEMLGPLRATIENRYKDMPLDIILLTDGHTWKQQEVFDYLNKQIQEERAPIRVFTLGIGSGVSHSLIEGIAKAGNGFSQSVQEGEKMSSKVVRMLKGALSPHVGDYTLEVKYSAAEEDDFEIVEKVADSLKVKLELTDKESDSKSKQQKKPISLFDTSADLDNALPTVKTTTEEDRYAHLTPIPAPRILQAPQDIPPLFAFNRTTVYLLLGPEAPCATPTSVILRGTSSHGPLELEIPIQVLDAPGETIHQLAAKKAVSELEQGRGWLAAARDADGQLLKTRFDGRFSDMVEREAVRLGVQFQVGGKWCSFVATEKTPRTKTEKIDDNWEYLEDEARTEQRSLFAGMTQQRPFGQAQQSLFGQAQQQQNSGARLFSTSQSRTSRSPAYGVSGVPLAGCPNPFSQVQQQGAGPFSSSATAPDGRLYGGAPGNQQKPSAQMQQQSLFAQPQQQQNSGGLFGALSANHSNPSATTQQQSLFGQAQQQQNTGGGLFSSAPSRGGLFGAPSPDHGGKGGGHGGGLFGGASGNHQNPSATMPQQSLFGQAQQQQNPGGLFGASTANHSNPDQNATTQQQSLFGQAQQQQSSGGGLFSSAPSRGGLFGAPSSDHGGRGGTSGGGLFGASTVNHQNPSSSMQQQQQLSMPTGTSSLFGSSASPAVPSLESVATNGSFLFGGATAPAANALQDYQMQCMMLEQQNKNRLLMSKQSTEEQSPYIIDEAHAEYAPNFSPLASHGADTSGGYSAFSAQGTSSPGYHQYSKTLSRSQSQLEGPTQGHTATSPRYTPISPGYAPMSPRFTPTSPGYAPESPQSIPSPVYSPDSPEFAHVSPRAVLQSLHGAPTSRQSSPAAPQSAPVSPAYSPTSPQYYPSSPTYSPPSPRAISKTPPPPPHPSTPDALLLLLIKHQSFNGSFTYTAPLLSYLGTSVPEFNQCLVDAKLEPSNADDCAVLFTALVVVYMERKMQDLQGAWELVVEKARGWLEGARADQGGADVLLRAAESLVAV